MRVPDPVGLPDAEGVTAPVALCDGEGVPLGDAACVAVNEGELETEAPRERVMVGEPEAVGATEAVEVSVGDREELGDIVELAVLVVEAVAAAEGDCIPVELDGVTEGAGVCTWDTVLVAEAAASGRVPVAVPVAVTAIISVQEPVALCVSDDAPLGDATCDEVNEGVLDDVEPRESVAVGEPEVVGATQTDAVRVGDRVELGDHVKLAVLVTDPEPACEPVALGLGLLGKLGVDGAEGACDCDEVDATLDATAGGVGDDVAVGARDAVLDRDPETDEVVVPDPVAAAVTVDVPVELEVRETLSDATCDAVTVGELDDVAPRDKVAVGEPELVGAAEAVAACVPVLLGLGLLGNDWVDAAEDVGDGEGVAVNDAVREGVGVDI